MGVWDSWREVTQFLESTRIALGRELRLWNSIEIPDKENSVLLIQDGPREYKVTVAQHLSAISGDQALCSAVLVYSFALTEAAARQALGIPDEQGLEGGIEFWGERLLASKSSSWAQVKDGKSGCVEVSVVRNAIAHGSTRVDQSMRNRLDAAGAGAGWQVGDPVRLDYEKVLQYRARLKSFLRSSGI